MGKKSRAKAERKDAPVGEPRLVGDPRLVGEPRLIAAIDLLRRSGAHEVQLRYSDDEEPVVWLAVAAWNVDAASRPTNREGPNVRTAHEAAGALDPISAALRLLDLVLDGAECAHCGRTSGVTEHWQSEMPLSDALCWYVYDPETERYRRSCEGDTE